MKRRSPSTDLAPASISRRDFLDGALIGAGAALIGLDAGASATPPRDMTAPGPEWYGYGGVGDYAPSHGNTPEVVSTAHRIRDGQFDRLAEADIIDTGEHYDVVVVGGGVAGLSAAYEFNKNAPAGQSCLLLDNHPVFGGEAKRNEFMVRGQRLIAPQGANGFFTPPPVTDLSQAVGDPRWYDEIGVPRSFEYESLPPARAPVQVANDNFGFIYWMEHTANIGYFYGRGGRGRPAKLVRDQWFHELEGTPYTNAERAQLLNWRRSLERPHPGSDFGPWLDSMTYQHYIEQVMGLGPHVTRYADPIVASVYGLGCDAVSAYAAYGAVLPGVMAYHAEADRRFTDLTRNSFPGGNDGFARHFLKRMLPNALYGTDSFADIITAPINFGALDVPGSRIRMRLSATAVRIEHEGPAAAPTGVRVTYAHGGRLYRIRARGLVSAAGGWIAKHAIRDLPERHRAAYDTFLHAPFLIANVALNNWRFLYDAGISACRYTGEFGFTCNIRRPMIVGDYHPRLDPDAPTVLTFYVPFAYPGLPPKVQGATGRGLLLGTSYADYERQIIRQLRSLFGRAFEPRRDVAGIILNRWGHAYSVPSPGFYFGRDGQPAPRDIIREPFGRMAFGHSELHGLQHWGYAADEGHRAMRQVLEAIG